MAEKSSSKQMSINLIASLIAFCVNIGINFFLAPYLVGELGEEAYGFIGLSTDFIQYGTIITAALNSMSGRFISVEYHRGKIEKASRIFSSVLVANLILAGVLLIVSGGIVFYLDIILDIPAKLVATVKITFAITFLTFVVSVITAIFTTASYVKNRLEIDSIRDIASNLFRVALIVMLFTVFDAQLYFLALAGLGRGVMLLVTNVTVKRKILPEVQVKFSRFDKGIVKTLLMSGVWMSCVQLSSVLMNSFDLLICNVALGAGLAGLLAISKTVPSSMNILISTLATIFSAHYTILFSKDKIKELVQEIKFTSKIPMFIMTVPLAGFMVFGKEFYSLWQPTLSAEKINMVQLLSVIACFLCLFISMTQCCIMVFSVVNKLKIPVLVNIGIGIASVMIVIAVLIFGGLEEKGVYIIAGVSSVLMSMRTLGFVPVYSAKLLGEKWTVFYPEIIRGMICFTLTCGVFFAGKNLVRDYFGNSGWMSFVLFCGVMGIIGYALSLFVLFGIKDVKKLAYKVLKKI